MKNIIELFEKMYKIKDTCGCYKIGSIDINENDKVVINKSVEVRNIINEHIKEVTNIFEYDRGSKNAQIDYQGVASEIMFSKFLWNLYKNLSPWDKRKFSLKGPEVATILPNKHKDDFHLSFNDLKLDFDTKSKFLSNTSVNINEKAHIRFTERKSDFYILVVLNNDFINIDKINSMDFILLTNEFINNNAKLINGKRNNYLKIDMKNIEQFLRKNDLMYDLSLIKKNDLVRVKAKI